MPDRIVDQSAQDFFRESDHNNSMWDIYVAYRSSESERAYKIVDVGTTKIVNEDGRIVPIDTAEFIGGVMFKLIENGTVDAEEWTPARVLGLTMKIGEMLGRKKERNALIRSAAKASVQSANGPVIPAQWLRDLWMPKTN